LGEGYILEQPIEFILVLCAWNYIWFRRFSTTSHILYLWFWECCDFEGEASNDTSCGTQRTLGACFSRGIHAGLSALP